MKVSELLDILKSLPLDTDILLHTNCNSWGEAFCDPFIKTVSKDNYFASYEEDYQENRYENMPYISNTVVLISFEEIEEGQSLC